MVWQPIQERVKTAPYIVTNMLQPLIIPPKVCSPCKLCPMKQIIRLCILANTSTYKTLILHNIRFLTYNIIAQVSSIFNSSRNNRIKYGGFPCILLAWLHIKVIFYWSFSSIERCLQLKFVLHFIFHQVVYHQWLSPIQGTLLSKIIFQWMLVRR